MKLDYSSIGIGIFTACIGISIVVSEINKSERRQACDARGGALVDVSDSLASEKRCVVPAPGVKP